MKTFIPAVLVFALTILFQNVFAQDTESYTKTANRLVELINAADYSGVENLFNQEMSKALPLKKATEFFAGMKAQFGRIQKLDQARHSAGWTVFPAHFERGLIDMSLVLDRDNKIAGLNFKPQAASSEAESKKQPATESYTKVANRLVKLINAADYSAVENLFNKEMSKVLPLEKATEFFDGLTGQAGKIQKLDEPKRNGEGMVFPARFERAMLDMSLALDDENKIAGLTFKPQATSSEATSKSQLPELSLPFKGRWFVMQGGDTLNVNHHMSLRAQWYAIDFMKVGGPSQRELAKTDGSTIEDFYSWGEPVLSPCAGEVVEVVNDQPDNPLGKKDPQNPAGNHVVIKVAPDRYVFVAHFQQKSVKAKVGDRLNPGQEIGKCGNSGNSDAPHVHMHIQDEPVLNQGEGQNLFFESINVELTGKVFEKVDWPLIQGLFVWP